MTASKDTALRVGARVRVRSWAKIAKTLDRDGSLRGAHIVFVRGMRSACGLERRVTCVRDCGYVTLQGLPWSWAPDWLEAVSDGDGKE